MAETINILKDNIFNKLKKTTIAVNADNNNSNYNSESIDIIPPSVQLYAFD